MIRFKHILFSLTIALSSCVKPYDFDVDSYEKVIVIDGQLTNETGGHYVELKYTYPLDTVLSEYIENGQVWLESSTGESIEFEYSENGIYLSPDDFSGEIGVSYTLQVVISEDESYSSNSTKMIAPPSIEKIYGEYAVSPNEDGDENIGGIQFFIDTNDDSADDATRFRFSYEETYKIIVPYPAAYELVQDTIVQLLDKTPGICYSQTESSEILYGTTMGNTENKLTEFPIVFVSEEDPDLLKRYSLLVKQYTISDDAYSYYRELNENEQGGSLFDKQTGSIYGNISSSSGDPVLGYFEVASLSTKREFFDPEDFDERLNLAGFPYTCSDAAIIVSSVDSASYWLNTYHGNIFSYASDPDEEVYIHTKYCTDCSWYADVTPPEFWID